MGSCETLKYRDCATAGKGQQRDEEQISDGKNGRQKVHKIKGKRPIAVREEDLSCYHRQRNQMQHHRVLTVDPVR